MSQHAWTIGILAVAALVSALAVVAAQNDTRKQFRELQALEQKVEDMDMEWGRLELEQGAWTSNARIESLATERLEMKIPRMGDTVMVLQ